MPKNINKEILEGLKNSTGSNNAEAVRATLPMWDKSEKFPLKDAMQYLKMQTWDFEEFGFRTELAIKAVLPEWMLRVFFDMKEFRRNVRNELTSTCEAMSKMRGYPMQSQDDKAFCQYDYSLRKYYEE